MAQQRISRADGLLEDHFDLRMDPRKLVPGARSVISLMYNYFPEEQSLQESAPKIARYALGRDYHKVLRKKMKQLMRSAHEQWGEVGGRAFVDSGPVHERAWARRSGLGWVGKNSLLLNKQHGSYFFLCELILDVEIAADDPVTDHCGSCTRCIDACPTDAIVADQVIDSQKCISYLTIELKEAIPEEFSSQLNGWAFGCDICQEVCPGTDSAARIQNPIFIRDRRSVRWTKSSGSRSPRTFSGRILATRRSSGQDLTVSRRTSNGRWTLKKFKRTNDDGSFRPRLLREI